MSDITFDARLDTVPLSPGVYLMKDSSGVVIYVGKAKKLMNRLRSYFGGGTITIPKVAAMVSHVADFEYVVVGTEEEALLLEANLIKRYNPKYNILLKDDKGYPYIVITMNESFPRVAKSFRIDKAMQKEGALYFGPYMGVDLKYVLESIDSIFPLKKCNRVLPRDIGKERPCLNYHIGKCLAPCAGGVNADDYREMMDQIVLFFKGKYDVILDKTVTEMKEAAENLDFEKAAIIRDRVNALENVRRSQRVFMNVKRDVDAIGVYSDAGETSIRKLELRDGRIVGSSVYFVNGDRTEISEIVTNFITQYYDGSKNIPSLIVVPETTNFEEEDKGSLEKFISMQAGHKVEIRLPERGELKEFQHLADTNAKEMMVRRILRGGGANADPLAPIRILEREFNVEEGAIKRVESFDISNLGNDDICAGMVVFVNGKPQKTLYRLFKMKSQEGQNDFGSIRETLTRRLMHTKDGFEYPSLILVDGGKGQLSAVASVVRQAAPDSNILLAGMVKNRKHKTSSLLFEDGRELVLDKDNQSDDDIVLLRFLIAVQNVVHRYAVTYQRKLSKKRNLKYRLEEIPGIGPSKGKTLLTHFGTIKAIENASVEELMKVKGVTSELAHNVRWHFHPDELKKAFDEAEVEGEVEGGSIDGDSDVNSTNGNIEQELKRELGIE
ncbi:MAG: excinuclease ABC subunit UvrC [Saccharofermentanales bacterium]